LAAGEGNLDSLTRLAGAGSWRRDRSAQARPSDPVANGGAHPAGPEGATLWQGIARRWSPVMWWQRPDREGDGGDGGEGDACVHVCESTRESKMKGRGGDG